LWKILSTQQGDLPEWLGLLVAPFAELALVLESPAAVFAAEWLPAVV
jgi:hypothetical protein